MVWHTLHAFAHTPHIQDVWVVVAPDDAQMDELLRHHAADWADASGSCVPIRAARIGGETRAASVLAGLRHLKQNGADDADWVLVHDAARIGTPEPEASAQSAAW